MEVPERLRHAVTGAALPPESDADSAVMRTFIYLLSLMLALPGMAAAAALLILAHAIGQRHLFALLYDLLERALDAFTWALPVAALMLLALAVAGCRPRMRRVAATILLLLNAAALAVVLREAYFNGPIYEQLALLPPFLSMLGCGWLAFSRERRRVSP